MEFAKFFKPFLSRDISLDTEQHRDDCPFCDKEDHFFANVRTGQWDCKKCGLSGNQYTFIRELHARYLATTSPKDHQTLAKTRGIPAKEFREAQFAYNRIAGQWYIPYPAVAYNGSRPSTDPKKGLVNLGYFTPPNYRIYKCLPLAVYCPAMLAQANNHQPLPQSIYLCEGEWDALAFQTISETHTGHRNLNPKIFGVPGAKTFKDTFVEAFKQVEIIRILYDHDEDGTLGIRKVAKAMFRPGRKIEYLNWDLLKDSILQESPDFDISVIKDVRDLLIHHPKGAWDLINSAMQPVTKSMLSDKPKKTNSNNGNNNSNTNGQVNDGNDQVENYGLAAGYHSDISTLAKVETWQEYMDAYRNIQYINEENEKAMMACMALVLTNHIQGEPLRLFLVGPASGGKTTFIESFGGKNQLFDYTSKLTAKSLVSGWKGADTSMLPHLHNKILMVKDYTVNLSDPPEAQRELQGILRDVYDGVLKIQYGNGELREYHGIRFNMLAGVTDAIHLHNDSEFGERWLKVDFLGEHYNEHRYIKAALANLGKTTAKKEALTKATLGFIHAKLYQILGDEAGRLLAGEEIDFDRVDTSFEIPEEHHDNIASLGRLMTRMLISPSTDRFEGIRYRPRPALATRASIQLAKLWKGLTWVLSQEKQPAWTNKLIAASWNIVQKVTFDTCHGFTFDVFRFVYENPGASAHDIRDRLSLPSTRVHRILTDLKILNILKIDKRNNGSGRRGRDIHGLIVDNKVQEIYAMAQSEDLFEK